MCLIGKTQLLCMQCRGIGLISMGSSGSSEELGVCVCETRQPTEDQPARQGGGRQSPSEPWPAWATCFPSFHYIPSKQLEPLHDNPASTFPPQAIRQGSSSHFWNNKGFYRVI